MYYFQLGADVRSPNRRHQTPMDISRRLSLRIGGKHTKSIQHILKGYNLCFCVALLFVE
jgi:hypothetical protein